MEKTPFHKAQLGREDFQRSSIITRPGRSSKWRPAWAFDDAKIRLVVYNHLYRYVQGFTGKGFTGSPSLVELEKLTAEARSRLPLHDGNLAKHIATIGD